VAWEELRSVERRQSKHKGIEERNEE